MFIRANETEAKDGRHQATIKAQWQRRRRWRNDARRFSFHFVPDHYFVFFPLSHSDIPLLANNLSWLRVIGAFLWHRPSSKRRKKAENVAEITTDAKQENDKRNRFLSSFCRKNCWCVDDILLFFFLFGIAMRASTMCEFMCSLS